MAPEPRSVDKCAELRSACQASIFKHMDGKMDEVMLELGDIKASLSYFKGQRNGKAEAERGSRLGIPTTAKYSRRFPWKEVAAAVVIICSAILSLGAVFRGASPDEAEIVKAVVEALKQERTGNP